MISRYQRCFGVGPLGAALSLGLFCLAWLGDRWLGGTPISSHQAPLTIAALAFLAIGLGLHFWSAYTLRTWWAGGGLCTKGPFRFFRHPMYAGWIVFNCLALALFLNSWLLVLWVVLLQPLWHALIPKEEAIVLDAIGDDYRIYCEKTGRFLPRLW